MPTYVAENERREQDIRFSAQLKAFQTRANEMLALVAEKGGTAVEFKQTKTRITE